MPPERKQVLGTATPIGTPNVSDAPGGYRRYFRFSQLAVGEAGKARNIEDIWATFLQELEDLGIPEEARSRLQSIGPKRVLGKEGIGKSVTSLMDAPNLKLTKEVHVAAKAALKGIGPHNLKADWARMLKDFAENNPDFQTPNGRRILSELKAIDPSAVAKHGSNQTLSVLARRGEDPKVLQWFNKAMKRPGTATLPAGITETLKVANAGKLPKVAKAAAGELAAGGLAAGKGLGRKAAGVLGRTALGPIGLAVTAGFGVHQASGILGRSGRAKKMALQGFSELGPSSSADYLRAVVGEQEAVSRRKTVMQKFEPELFQEVVRILSDTSGGSSGNTLTSTERRIGSDAQSGVQSRGRSPEDTQFLLNELFSQMGG